MEGIATVSALPGLASSSLPCRSSRPSRNQGQSCSAHACVSSAARTSTSSRTQVAKLTLKSSFISNGLPIPTSASGGVFCSPGFQIHRGRCPAVQAFFDIPEIGPLRDALFACAGAMAAFSLAGALVFVTQRNNRKVTAAAEERGPASIPEPGLIAQALEMGMGLGGQKESVEWVNMVLHKIWKIYRRSLEAWLVGLLQPAIDTLPLPSIVRRVEIAEFSLDYEPLSVRNVQRRASRRANDLQYHVGLRYTGDARCLLLLHLTVAGIDFAVPVGVHNLDVDAELWVKLRLTPRKPYVGTLSIAFVRLPTIKLVLAPFRIVNLFAIPFLSNFLSKLLTVDLPRLLVLPRHITFDFLPAGEEVSQQHPVSDASPAGSSANLVLDLLKSETFTGLAGQEPILSPIRTEPSDAFVGELTVTLCEARNLPSLGLAVFSNPYCRLMVGEAVVESKKNSETSHPAGARDPVWNQDFLFWVEDPAKQKLTVVIRDSMAPLSRNIGFVEVPIWQLQDCAPLSMWLPLLQDGPFGVKPAQGEVRLLLTYKSYVDKEDRVGPAGGVPAAGVPAPADDVVAYIKVFGGEGEVEGEVTEPDSDGERERELQREREKKGLDKLGEEPGVEIVASNEGAAGVPLSPPPAVETAPMAAAAPPPAAPEGERAGIVRSAWKATRAVTIGAAAVAGGVLGGAGGLLWSAGGAVASGAGAVASAVGRRVASFVAWEREGADQAEPLYLYEDDEYFTPDTSVRVTSYLSDGDSDREDEGQGNTQESESTQEEQGSAGSLGHDERVAGTSDGEDHNPGPAMEGGIDEGLRQDPSYGPGAPATVEQRVARLVEWNLDMRREDSSESLAAAPRLHPTMDDSKDEGEDRPRSATGKLSGVKIESPPQLMWEHEMLQAQEQQEQFQRHTASEETDEEEEEARLPVLPKETEASSDRWRNVQGAISDLLDFFNR